MHDRDFSHTAFSDYSDEPYFRLYHSLKNIRKTICVNFEAVTAGNDCSDDYIRLIALCYPDIKITHEQMGNMRKSPVFRPDLWILVKETGSGKIVGGGIAEFDGKIGELILEWIQVVPYYRRRGLGALIVNELLLRGRDGAFATVSGKVCSPSKPELLYRACGFTGSDVWHILTQKN